MDFTEKTVERNEVFRGKIFGVRNDVVELPDGTRAKREVVDHAGGAAVLCVCGGKVALVRQYRYAYGETTIEIPAGKLERGEDPAQAASRELKEETGYSAEKFRKIYTLYPTPGYTNEKIYIYYAEGLKEGESHPDEGELLGLEFLPLEEAYRLVDDGVICDSKTVAALLWYRCNH